MRIAVIGSGLWARYQVAGWQVLPGVHIAALYNRTRPKAEALAREFRIPAVYDDREHVDRQVRDHMDDREQPLDHGDPERDLDAVLAEGSPRARHRH